MIMELNNYEDIKRILYDQEIWTRISEDGQEKNLNLSTKGLNWYGFFEESKLIGILLSHNIFKYTVQVHVSVLKEYRDKYSVKCGESVLEHFLSSSNQKMIAVVPAIYQDVYHFTKKMGLKDEGINRGSYFKNGEMVDQYMMGITRTEAMQWLQQRL